MTAELKISISTSGPFHLFETARELQDRGCLGEIFTAYPLFKLARWGVERRRIRAFPYLYAPWMLMNRFNFHTNGSDRAWDRLLRVSHDGFCRRHLSPCDIFIGLSSFSLWSGRFAKEKFGALYVCERGSTHISFQERVLRKEYEALGLPHRPQSRFVVERELAEYEAADYVSAPSRVVWQSFIDSGVSAKKLILQPYGINTAYFKPTKPKSDVFKVVFVGALSVRKGLHKLIRAVELIDEYDFVVNVIGSPTADARFLRSLSQNPKIAWLGHLPWEKLVDELSSAHAMVLPSIEEGLAIVQGQALACGCPVIASRATGAEDLFVDGKHGIILDECTPETIAAAIVKLHSDRTLCAELSTAASQLARSLGGWADYGDKISSRFLALLDRDRPQ